MDPKSTGIPSGTLPTADPPILSLPTQIPSLGDTYGALFIGMCLSILLYGVTVHQVYRYFRLYPKDQILMKFIVLSILCDQLRIPNPCEQVADSAPYLRIVETLHTIMPIHIWYIILAVAACRADDNADSYYHLVSNYFNPIALLTDTWSLRILAPISVVAMTLCQGFYVRRVYILGPQYRLLVALAIVLLLAELGRSCILYTLDEPRLMYTPLCHTVGFMIALTVQAFKGHQVEDLGNMAWLVSAIYGFAVAVDSIVTGVLIAVLLKSRTGFRSTDSLIQTLVIYTVNSGLVPSIAGILSFVFALSMSGNMVYVAMGVVATKLYANSVLAVLNARRSLAERALNGFTANTLQMGGNLQPATSTVIFAQRNSRPVSVSLPPSMEDSERDATHAESESEGAAREITGENKV
ncbi:hypothetical protein NUW54_g3582 [Trametes sanguinea]|uniref:Uncharacterized protein n=1 Tax=Trametes sanguinea TaxID=158606 RepID=A0ACC1Q2V6_9APHY|nr:hypothetical protein NUW54_g3582 [Trametes sanguinea]